MTLMTHRVALLIRYLPAGGATLSAVDLATGKEQRRFDVTAERLDREVRQLKHTLESARYQVEVRETTLP